MAYLNMQALVSIGEIVIPHINSFTIDESIKELSDTATIVLAKNYKQLQGSPVLKYIQAGYPVEIQCGYNGNLQTEFTGFVKPGISADFPLTIECDELFLLRQQNVVASWRQVTLKELLHEIAPGYQIECPDTQLGKMLINNASPYQVLNDLKKKFGFYSRINGNLLSVGFAYAFSPSFTKNYQYTIDENVKDAKSLKYRTDIDFNTRVEATIIVKGKKKVLTEGSKDADARVQRIDVNRNLTEEQARNIAKAQLKRVLYEGYTGNIVGFGTPRTHAGDSIDIIDKKQLERQGRYLIEKVSIEYAEAHIDRTNAISFKI